MRTILPAEKNPALRAEAKPIPTADIKSARVRKLIAEMKQLLSKEKYGVAIAACQVGEPVALFIVSGRALAHHASDDDEGNEDAEIDARKNVQPDLPDQIYINPEILKVSRRKKDMHEGCLSVRGKWGHVPRAEKASIRAYDEEGRVFTRGASGFLAHVFQHEMDHLSGILYTDKASKLYDEKSDDEE